MPSRRLMQTDQSVNWARSALMHPPLQASTPAYLGPEAGVEAAMLWADHDSSGTLNRTEIATAMEVFVPSEVWDDSLLELVKC